LDIPVSLTGPHTPTRERAWRDEDGNRAATRLVFSNYLTFPSHLTYTFHKSQTKNKLELLIPDPAQPAAISHT
jgi:hypothetical protein